MLTLFWRKRAGIPKADCGAILTRGAVRPKTAQKTTIAMIQKRSFLFKNCAAFSKSDFHSESIKSQFICQLDISL
jgi:hypothetical protein